MTMQLKADLRDVFHWNTKQVHQEHEARAMQHLIAVKVTVPDSQDLPEFNIDPAQAFMYITAEFETPKNEVNQAVVWSRIVQKQKDANIKETVRFGYPYQLTDPGES